MKLPNPDNTYIDDNKLVGYSLNFNHAEGQHKARVFKAALGLTLENLAELKNALLELDFGQKGKFVSVKFTLIKKEIN